MNDVADDVVLTCDIQPWQCPELGKTKPSYSQKASECIVMVGFDVHRMTDISRSQLISACKTLHIKIGEEKSKSAITRLVAKAMMDQGVVRAVHPDTDLEVDIINRSELQKAKTF